MTLTRADLLLRGVAGAGVVLAGPLAGRAFAQGGGDVDVLRFGLTLEQLELVFYENSAGVDLSPAARALVDEFAGHQRAFVEALEAAIEELGGPADRAPRFRFTTAGGESAFVAQAAALEDAGVAALNGAGLRIESKQLLAVAGSIVATEAAHAATWRLLAEETPTPASFDERFTRKRALRALRPFLPR